MPPNIPKHYSLVKEHPKSYEIHDSRDDSKFHIAKGSLDLGMHAKLSKIQKFADGGDVAPDALLADTPAQVTDVPTSFTPQGSAADAAPTADPKGLSAEDLFGTPGKIVSNIADKYSNLMDKGEAYNAGQITPEEAAGQAPASAPSANTPAQRIDPANLAIPGTQPASQKMPNPMAEYNSAFGLEKSGIQQQTDAMAQKSQMESDLYKQQIQDLQELKTDHDTKLSALNKRSDDMFNAVQNEKINPEHYWQSHSKIGAAIGILLGGIGAGASGSNKNMVLDNINNNIEKDIDAQKSNLTQKNNLYKMNLDRTKNEQEAYALTKADMLTMTAAKSNQIAAQIGTPLAQAMNKQLQGELGLKIASAHQQLATVGIAQKAYSEGIPVQAVPLLHPDQQKRMVRLPNGLMADAGSEGNAKEYNEQTAAFGPIMQDLNTLKKLNTVGSVFSPADRARANELQSHIVTELNDLSKAHRISEADIGFQKGQLSDPTSIKNKMSGDWNAATDQLIQSLINKHESIGTQYVPAFGAMKLKKDNAFSRGRKT